MYLLHTIFNQANNILAVFLIYFSENFVSCDEKWKINLPNTKRKWPSPYVGKHFVWILSPHDLYIKKKQREEDWFTKSSKKLNMGLGNVGVGRNKSVLIKVSHNERINHSYSFRRLTIFIHFPFSIKLNLHRT